MELIQTFEDYLLKEKNFSKHTILAYSEDVKVFHEFLISSKQTNDLLDVNYNMIRKWIINMSENELSNKTINRKITSLKTFYKFLVKSKQLDNTPLVKHKSLKVEKKIIVPFSELELESIFENYFLDDDFDSIRNRLIIELLYATGIRRSELITLKEVDVDLNNYTIKVLGKRSKERILPILNSTLETIQKYLELKKHELPENKEELFFVKKNGKKLSETFVYRLINDYFSSVSEKVKKSPHVLRHTFATHLLNNGADLNSVKELLGHASLSSTQIYTHSSLDELKKIYFKAHPRNK